MRDEISVPRADFSMTTDQFRAGAREVGDWIADYWERVEQLPVFPKVTPGDVLKSLPVHPPQTGEPLSEMLRDVSGVIEEGSVHWQSPNFFAYFAGNTSGPSVLGDMIASAMSSNVFQWAANPAGVELEMLVMDWMAEMLGLPEQFKFSGGGGGVIQDGSSMAALCSIVAARERFGEPFGRLRAYVTSETHSSVEKGLHVAGFSRNNVCRVAIDEERGMVADALRQAMRSDKAQGFVPCFVAATLGTTSSTAVDPISEIGPVCKEFDAWLHVDAAMAGAALICPEYRHHAEGIELARSFSFNPHKWLFTNTGCCCMFVADRKEFTSALTITPEYLRDTDSAREEVAEYRNWTVQLGKRINALKLWFVVRHYGVQGLQYHLREHLKLAAEFRRWVEQDENFQLLAPVKFNLVCFRHKAGNDFNRELLSKLNASGGMYITHTSLDGIYTLRLHIGQTSTRHRHIKQAWQLIRETAAEMRT